MWEQLLKSKGTRHVRMYWYTLQAIFLISKLFWFVRSSIFHFIAIMSTDLTALIQVATDILNLLPNVALIEQHIRSCWKIIIKVLWSAEIVVVCNFLGVAECINAYGYDETSAHWAKNWSISRCAIEFHGFSPSCQNMRHLKFFTWTVRGWNSSCIMVLLYIWTQEQVS